MPRRSGSLLLLLLIALTARAEFPVTEERPLAPTLGISRDARVVATDTGFLAFWSTRTTYGEEGLAQVARFSPEGVLERRATAWELPASFQWLDAASNGEEVLLTGICTGEYDRPLCLARFSAAGDFLDLTTLPFRRVTQSVLASNGDDFLLVIHTVSPREVLAIRVSRRGEMGTPLLLDPWGSSQQFLSAAAIGGTYVAAFRIDNRLILTRLGDDEVDKTISFPLTPNLTRVRMEGSNERLLLIADARFAILDRELNVVLDWSPLETGSSSIVAPTSSGWIVATAAGAGLRVESIFMDGRHGPATAMEGAPNTSFDAAGRGARASVVWTTTLPQDPSDSVARMVIVDGAGRIVRNPHTISLGPAPQLDPAGTHGDGVTMAVWSERSANGTFMVNARPFDANGRAVAPPTSMPHRSSHQRRAAVAFNGDSFFVVWSEGLAGTGGVFGARVTAGGELLDSEAIPLFGMAPLAAGRARTASVDWSGTAWIVVSSDERWRILGTRVSSQGVVLDAIQTEISPPRYDGPSGDFAPVIDCNGTECLVAWQGPPIPTNCRVTCEPPPPTVRATRISPELTLLDVAPSLLTPDWEYVRDLSVSWNEIADEWLVRWSNNGMLRLTREGFLSPAEPGAWLYLGSSSAIPEREGWRIAWQTDLSGDLFHAWTATGAVPGLESHFALTRTPEREWNPRLVAAPRAFALFLRESQIDAGSPRVIGRFLDESIEPAPPVLELRAERIGLRVRLTWETGIGGIPRFNVETFDSYWRYVTQVPGSARSVEISPGRATKFRVTAYAPSGGMMISNVVEVPGARQRTVEK